MRTQRAELKTEVENEWFKIETGVRQGGVKSLLFFILYMDRWLKEICMVEEITLAYADGVAVVTGTLEDLQKAITRWNDTFNRMGMKINKQKTVIMKVERIKEECKKYVH